MKDKNVTVFGGSGFVGQAVVTALSGAGARVRVVSRHSNSALSTKPSGRVGQIVLSEGNIRDEASIERAVKGADAVVNAVGILHESGKQQFHAIHAQAAERIAKISKQQGVKQLVHISSLGVDRAVHSRYARSKLNGEKAVLAAFSGATILRPSVIFGSGDSFFNLFAKISKFSPLLPLIGGGKTKFQPVFVGDVADAVVTVLLNNNFNGKILELGGPKIYSFEELMQLMLRFIGKKRCLMPIPFALASLQGVVMQQLPNPLLTLDQVTLLRTDNVLSNELPGFRELNIMPKSVEEIVPSYLSAAA